MTDGLALAGNAPKIFTKVTRNGLPLVSLLFCAAFSALAYMGISSGSGKVFNWFVNSKSFLQLFHFARASAYGLFVVTSIAGLMTWFGISVTYVRFYKGFKVQGFDRSTLPYAHSLQPYAAWYAMFMCLLICFVSLCVSAPVYFGADTNSAVLGLVSLPQRQVGDRYVRHELHPPCAVPNTLHRLEALHSRADGQARGYGLCLGPEGDRGGLLRRAPSEELGRAFLVVAGEFFLSAPRAVRVADDCAQM